MKYIIPASLSVLALNFMQKQALSSTFILNSLPPFLGSSNKDVVVAATNTFCELKFESNPQLLTNILNNNVIQLLVFSLDSRSSLRALSVLLAQFFDVTVEALVDMDCEESLKTFHEFGEMASNSFVDPLIKFFCTKLLGDSPLEPSLWKKLTRAFQAFWMHITASKKSECLSMMLKEAEEKAKEHGHIKDAMLRVLLCIAKSVEVLPVLEFIIKVGSGGPLAAELLAALGPNAIGMHLVTHIICIG